MHCIIINSIFVPVSNFNKDAKFIEHIRDHQTNLREFWSDLPFQIYVSEDGTCREIHSVEVDYNPTMPKQKFQVSYYLENKPEYNYHDEFYFCRRVEHVDGKKLITLISDVWFEGCDR